MNDFKVGDHVASRRDMDSVRTVVLVKYHYVTLDDGKEYNYRDLMYISDARDELKARLDRLVDSPRLSEEELKHRAEVAEAFRLGRSLQYRCRSSPLTDSWAALDHANLHWAEYDYRVVPEKEGIPPTEKELKMMNPVFEQYGGEFAFTFIKFKARNSPPFSMLESSISSTLRESHYVFNRKKGVWE